ncbi:MAG: hypothetical protein P9X24_12230 [Candidatus Hatepunaea meridiana]|nr:hypothetical protein [Candidatus Hatepunaea meridiana]
MRITKRTKRTIKTGAVTFLDVLGWKGILHREKDPIQMLGQLNEDLQTKADKLDKGLRRITDEHTALNTQVIGISDSIAIFTESGISEKQTALELHGELCAYIIPLSIQRGIPMRGAVVFGDYIIDEGRNIFVGNAVDEAANWYEWADWIGVFMSPSAAFGFDVTESKVWINYRPPFKDNLKWETPCVDWFANSEFKSSEDGKLREAFGAMRPIFPENIEKLNNTLEFVNKELIQKNMTF